MEEFPPVNPANPQKRKGGRKPIYATSEERKQRNRQAQAAFRERRTEYIKHLEGTIKHHEDALQSLQQSHRTAADECLMLRYKNSLLERILLEKGIDVHAELAAKTGSPGAGPVNRSHPLHGAPLNQASTMQRAMMNRHQARRSTSSVPAKIEPATHTPLQYTDQHSPQLQPTPASHISSPSVHSPSYGLQNVPSPSHSAELLAQQQQQHQQQHPPRATNHQAPTRLQMTPSNPQPTAAPASATPSSAASQTFYASPFQNHIDQLGKFTRFLTLPSLFERAMFVLD
jgi:hypothetical protein